MNSKSIFLFVLCAFSLAAPLVHAQSETKETDEKLPMDGYLPAAFIAGSVLFGGLLYYGFFKARYNALDKQINAYSQQIAQVTTATDSLEQLLDLCKESSHMLWFERKRACSAKGYSILTHGMLSLGASACSCALLENQLSTATDETAESNQ